MKKGEQQRLGYDPELLMSSYHGEPSTRRILPSKLILVDGQLLLVGVLATDFEPPEVPSCTLNQESQCRKITGTQEAFASKYCVYI